VRAVDVHEKFSIVHYCITYAFIFSDFCQNYIAFQQFLIVLIRDLKLLALFSRHFSSFHAQIHAQVMNVEVMQQYCTSSGL